MKHKYIVTVICLLFILAACKQTSPDSGRHIPIGKRMQMVDFRLPSLTDNTMVDSGELRGKVLLVTFFATWCPPCIQEIPSFIDLQKSFGDKGFSVLAFSVDEGDTAPVQQLITKYKINYPVVLADSEIAKGFGGVSGIPVTFLVNSKGEIVKKYLGYVGYDTLAGEIKSLLAGG